MSGRHFPRGRGSASNPANRFTRIEVVPDEPAERAATVYLRDASRSIIATNTSPDIPFEASINPYRGCEHGCSYCYARTYHEYLELSAGIDFETRILVKEDAARLLRRELAAASWQPKAIDLSGVTDPYQPVERQLRITRSCLEVLAEHRNPVTVVTKNGLVTRDQDLLGELARFEAAAVCLSVTTLDARLAARLEPRTSQPRRRLEAISKLSAAGIPCGVIVAPCIPGLTDHELPRILEAAAGAGACWARVIPLRLPGAVAGIFTEWLETHAPLHRDKVLNRIRSMRGGDLNDPRIHNRMTGTGVIAEQMRALFHATCRRVGLATEMPALSTQAFRRPGGEQLGLFD
jgi:DNA repair photolyase